MRGLRFTHVATAAVALLSTLVCAAGASAQAPVAGLGDRLYSTGGDITVEVRPATAGLTSELRLYSADGTFIRIASNRDVGARISLPARPEGDELLFGIFVNNRTFMIGPGNRNPDGLPHAKVVNSGERQYDVGFEDLFNGGDRDYDDNVFRFSGGLAPNAAPVADDQKLTVAQGGSLPITLTGSDADGNLLTFALLDGPRHGAVTGTGAALTYTPSADFVGTDTFGFNVGDGRANDDGRVTITVTAATGGSSTPATPATPATPGAPSTGGSGIKLGDCPAGELTLLNVRQVGRRVLLTGLAERTLAGAPVDIVEGGLVVARTTIRSDGTIRLRVAVPRLRGGRVLRYQAKLGALQSRNVRLKRRMITTSAKLQRGRIVIKGRVTGAPRRGTRPLVRLLARPRGCGTRRTQIGRARLRRDGSFSVSGKPLAGVAVAVYQARAKLPARIVTFSLPQTIGRR